MNLKSSQNQTNHQQAQEFHSATHWKNCQTEPEGICKDHLRTSCPFLDTLWRPAGPLRDAGHEDWKLCFWMPIRVSGDTWSPNPPLPLLSSLLFLLSGGSECSGLHVLSRCVGIGENIKVKTKGAQKTPGNSATCVSIYVWESQGKGELFAYTGVCIGETGGCCYSHMYINYMLICVHPGAHTCMFVGCNFTSCLCSY